MMSAIQNAPPIAQFGSLPQAGAVGNNVRHFSTGLRIESAKDDAAGLVISERFRADVTGAAKKAQDAADPSRADGGLPGGDRSSGNGRTTGGGGIDLWA